MRSVRYVYFNDFAWCNVTFHTIELDRGVFFIIIDLGDDIVSGDVGCVLQVEDLAGCLANEQRLEVETVLVQRYEGVFADGTHFKNPCQLTATFLNLNDNCGDDYLGLIGAE